MSACKRSGRQQLVALAPADEQLITALKQFVTFQLRDKANGAKMLETKNEYGLATSTCNAQTTASLPLCQHAPGPGTDAVKHN